MPMNDVTAKAYAHIFVDSDLYRRIFLSHVYRVGDTVRVADEHYTKVIEVIWCQDEQLPNGCPRVNIRLETEGK